MYRARVEQISGSHVRADGKWLTCIGNKNVSVGDFIWTDGRCVYGYEQEGCTPLVITPQKEDEGIPILANADDFVTFQRNRFRHFPNSVESSYVAIINNKYHVYKSGFNARNSALFYLGLVLDKYTLTCTTDIDDSGNIYKISAICYPNGPSTITNTSSENENGCLINITKNNTVISQINYMTYYNIAKSKAISFARLPDKGLGIFTSGSSQVVWCFIENTGHWALVLESAFDADTYHSPYSDQNGDNGAFTNWIYFNSEGEQKQIHQYTFSHETNNGDFDGLEEIKFDIQDGYYFKVTAPIFDIFNNKISSITIYSPDNQKLYEGTELCKKFLNSYYRIPYITIYKITNKKYLIGVYTTEYYYKLYILDDGTLKDSEEISNNTKLRLMKKIKNWWKRIEEF